MAISDPYATAEQYRAVISPDRDENDDDLLTSDLTAISRYLDRKLGEFFSRDEEDVTLVVDVAYPFQRRYSAPVIHSGNTLPSLPPLVSVTSVTMGTSTPLLAADLELWPTGALLQPEPEPYREIRPAYQSGKGFGGGRAVIVGQRGWPAVPAAISAGTIQLTALWRLETPRATRRIPELGEAIETSPGAQAILYRLVEQYKVWWLA